MNPAQSTFAAASPSPRADGEQAPRADTSLAWGADIPDPLEFDLFRLDCAVEALRGADLSDRRADLIRIANNLTDLLENPYGHAH